MLLVKALTRKMHLKKADVFFMRVHKYISAALLVIWVLHIIFVFPVLKAHNIGALITGVLTAATMLLLIVLCHTITRDKRLNLQVHRRLSVVMVLGIIGHMVTYFVD